MNDRTVQHVLPVDENGNVYFKIRSFGSDGVLMIPDMVFPKEKATIEEYKTAARFIGFSANTKLLPYDLEKLYNPPIGQVTCFDGPLIILPVLEDSFNPPHHTVLIKLNKASMRALRESRASMYTSQFESRLNAIYSALR